MSARFFIERPVLAGVLSIVIVLAGLVAMRVLPIAQYPQIVPPQTQCPRRSPRRWNEPSTVSKG